MILKEISAILGFTIPKNEIEATFRTLEIDGRINKKEILKILILLITKEVEREKSE